MGVMFSVRCVEIDYDHGYATTYVDMGCGTAAEVFGFMGLAFYLQGRISCFRLLKATKAALVKLEQDPSADAGTETFMVPADENRCAVVNCGRMPGLLALRIQELRTLCEHGMAQAGDLAEVRWA